MAPATCPARRQYWKRLTKSLAVCRSIRKAAYAPVREAGALTVSGAGLEGLVGARTGKEIRKRVGTVAEGTGGGSINSSNSDQEDPPGKLFVVEGIDGSGKSTQIDLLHKWLVSQGYLVVFTEWNSSPIVRRTTRRGKRRRLLTPLSFSLIHPCDFANRVNDQILPALRAGAIVLADRYVYTAYARDGARGMGSRWLRRLYSFAPEPTMAFYFRRTSGRGRPAHRGRT